MIPIPSIVLAVVFLALSAMHVGWAFGIHWGLKGAIPELDGKLLFEPGKAGALLVAAALLAGAAISVWRGAFPGLGPAWIPHAGIWVIVVVFALRAVGDFRYCGFFKRVRETAFARNDSMIYSPLCIIVSVLALWLAWGS